MMAFNIYLCDLVFKALQNVKTCYANAMKKSIRILAIIPARGGSKSIHYKNIALINGKPMIYYTIKAAQESKLLDAFLVSTDDVKIANVAKKYGADVPFLRPAKLATDKAVDIDYLKHAVEWVEKERGWTPDIIVNLRPTSPLRTGQDIDNAIKVMEETGCDSIKTVHPPYENPYKMWHLDTKTKKMKPILPTKWYPKLFTDVPRQWLPQTYWQNCIVDVTRAKFIKKGIVFGKDMRGIVTDPRKSIDIDEPADLKRAAEMMRELAKEKSTKKTK